jgi:hypothetical protein
MLTCTDADLPLLMLTCNHDSSALEADIQWEVPEKCHLNKLCCE